MQRGTVTILVAVVAGACGQGLPVSNTADVHDSLYGKLVDQLVDRAVNVESNHQANLDDTTPLKTPGLPVSHPAGEAADGDAKMAAVLNLRGGAAESIGGTKRIPNRLTPATREATMHLATRIHKKPFKEVAPRATRAVKKWVSRLMQTKEVRLDPMLNEHIWSQGIRNPPKRIRVLMSRKHNPDPQAKEKMFTLVQHIPVRSFKGLGTVNRLPNSG